MEVMDTKQYLNQISRYDRMINNKLAEISQLRELAMSVSAVKNEERVQTTPDKDRLGSMVAKITDLEKETDMLIDRFVDLKKEIMIIISMVKSERHRDILSKKYLELKSIYEIAEELGITDRGCKKAHKKALDEFEKIKNTIYSTTIDSSPLNVV